MLQAPNAQRQTPNAFSLVEVVFATIFMAVIILGIAQLQTGNLVLSRTSVNEADAYFWASQGAEIMEGIGYDPTACGTYPCTKYLNGPPAVSTYQLSDTEETPLGGLFKRSVILDTTGLTNAYQVISRVEWTDSTGDHICDAEKSGCVDVKRIVF